MSEPGSSQRWGSLAKGMSFAGLGLSLGLTALVAVWAGNWLDERWGTSPLFALGLLLVALFGAMRRLIWLLKKHSKTG
jgi:ABC-type transport system involved in cytochrome c biogenesis permease subunit